MALEEWDTAGATARLARRPRGEARKIVEGHLAPPLLLHTIGAAVLPHRLLLTMMKRDSLQM